MVTTKLEVEQDRAWRTERYLSCYQTVAYCLLFELISFQCLTNSLYSGHKYYLAVSQTLSVLSHLKNFALTFFHSSFT